MEALRSPMDDSAFDDFSFRYIIGIDLGTTNSALAYVDLTAKEEGAGARAIRFLEIPQLVAPGEVSRRPVLPSFLYLPGPYELAPGSTALPWNNQRSYAVGEFAREQGALVSSHQVCSAKSWLCHGSVDRTADILPWGAKGEEKGQKVSPVDASARYLKHLREAWNEEVAGGREECRLEEQLVILTVPASFDEVARELTVSAAQKAGIGRVILVEEPLAAFYSWLSYHEHDWQKGMEAGQLILVCDVGGGTSDFTVVAIRHGEKGLRFDRLAVGDHLMLGGDNMDLALGRYLETQLLGQPGNLDTQRWHQLCHQCRKAKEMLLSAGDESARVDITVMGTGGKLIANTLKGTLKYVDVQRLILEGFFPITDYSDLPQEGSRTGLTEWGLPYVQEPSITRHLAAFWQRFETLVKRETGRQVVYPDYLLFNGGALTPGPIRRRIIEAVRHWFRDFAHEGWQPQELLNPHPELAVAVGAAYYGLVRLGEGVRIGAGSPRSFYVAVEAERDQIEAGLGEAVCLVPRGTEEGFETTLKEPAFEVLANQPVAFQLYCSSTRLGDGLGDLVALEEDEVTVFPPIKTLLRFGKKAEARQLPVQLVVKLTEVGTLELWCQSQQSPHRWRLQFDVRQDVDPSSAAFEDTSGEILEAALIEKAQNKISATFCGGLEAGDHRPEKLLKELSAMFKMQKEKWSTPLIRRLADALLKAGRGRRLTWQHEARWFNLLGYCLRPGVGDPVDQWRMKEVWKFYLQGLQFPRQVSCRLEQWIFLRRVAAGLTSGQQLRIYQQVGGYFVISGGKKKVDKQLPRRLNTQEELELLMVLANFERLPVETKIELGRLLLQRIQKKTRPQELWALSRLGSRIPLYGPLERVIPSQEAAAWVHTLLSLNLPAKEAIAHALIHLARLTGDRERDITGEDRQKVSHWLKRYPQQAYFEALLMNPQSLQEQEEQEWAFGETLPTGLKLSSSNKGD